MLTFLQTLPRRLLPRRLLPSLLRPFQNGGHQGVFQGVGGASEERGPGPTPPPLVADTPSVVLGPSMTHWHLWGGVVWCWGADRHPVSRCQRLSLTRMKRIPTMPRDFRRQTPRRRCWAVQKLQTPLKAGWLPPSPSASAGFTLR